VTDGQTDGQTDEIAVDITALCIASNAAALYKPGNMTLFYSRCAGNEDISTKHEKALYAGQYNQGEQRITR